MDNLVSVSVEFWLKKYLEMNHFQDFVRLGNICLLTSAFSCLCVACILLDVCVLNVL